MLRKTILYTLSGTLGDASTKVMKLNGTCPQENLQSFGRYIKENAANMLYSLRYINLPEGEIRVRGLYFVYVKKWRVD